MRLTDWRGNAYGIGDIVLYPRQSGRSVEMCEAVVEDIWRTYESWEAWEWKRLEEGEEPPASPRGRMAPAVAVRVKVQPTGRGSRNFHRTDSKAVYLDAEGNPTTYDKAADDTSRTYKSTEFNRETNTWDETVRFLKKRRNEKVPIKSVTILNHENLTVPVGRWPQ